MPAFIRTPGDEARWSKAKEAANKQHSESEGDRYWGLVNHIYQNMGKAELEKKVGAIRDLVKNNPDVFGSNIELLDKVLNTLVKAKGDDDEESEGPDHQDYELDENDLPKGMRVDEDPYEDESDEADAWLKEHGEKSASGKKVDEAKAEESPKVKGSSGYSDWKPQPKYAAEHEVKMKKLMDDGYSHREAEYMAGASQGPKDLQSALNHTTKQSQPSEKFRKEMQELAGHWKNNVERNERLNADPIKHPEKFAAGKMLQAHEAHSKGFNDAHNEFLSSEKLKDLRGLERHKAIQAWKNNWKAKNPEYHKSVGSVSDAHKNYKESRVASKKNLDEAIQHILGGGQNPDAMSMQEAAQHVGGEKGESGYTASTIKDPSASFAEANPEYVGVNRTKQEAAAAPAPKKSVGDPMAVIRRRANPEQIERLGRVTSARAAQGVGKKPEGAE